LWFHDAANIVPMWYDGLSIFLYMEATLIQ
jgi:hypothetical protein